MPMPTPMPFSASAARSLARLATATTTTTATLSHLATPPPLTSSIAGPSRWNESMRCSTYCSYATAARPSRLALSPKPSRVRSFSSSLRSSAGSAAASTTSSPSASPSVPPPSSSDPSTSKIPLSISHRPSSPIEDRLPSSPTMNLTPNGVKQLQSVYERENNNEKLALRVEVKPGGCHGYQYGMELTEERDEDDFIFQHPEKRGAKLLIDSTSLRLLQGSTIDYATELIGSQFVIRDNPQSKGAGCGCGVSWEPVVDI